MTTYHKTKSGKVSVYQDDGSHKKFVGTYYSDEEMLEKCQTLIDRHKDSYCGATFNRTLMLAYNFLLRLKIIKRLEERVKILQEHGESKMRVLKGGARKYTEVEVLDEQGQGNANHKYQIVSVTETAGQPIAVLGNIDFQNGPIREIGVNGVADGDLIAIVIDRMCGFQSGDYACDENQHALAHLESALEALQERTDKREARGVEGTNVK